MSNISHCPLSRCLTEPGYCEEFVTAGDGAQLALIVATPILIALLAPGIARGGWHQPCQRDDDTRESKHHSIDPPMFLCGIGLLPLDCGLSGLLTVVAAMAFAFVVIFFSMLYSSQPCTTALGKCRTISCACGNIISEGYVFMFALLTLTSAILVQRISAMPQHHRVQHRTIKPTLILGSLLLTLTGIFPERYDANGGMGGYLALLYGLHLLGVVGATLLLLGVPFAWFVEHYATHRREVPLRSLLARCAYFCATFGFVIGFCVYASDAEIIDQVPSICSSLRSRAHCEGWPLLTAEKCDAALGCVHAARGGGGGGGGGGLCAEAVQPNFLCAWLPNRQLSNWTREIFPTSYVESASCVRQACPLHQYARGVALEFGVLILTLTYVASFALHDVRRLLDRPPPEARLAAASGAGGDSDAHREPLQIFAPPSSDASGGLLAGARAS